MERIQSDNYVKHLEEKLETCEDMLTMLHSYVMKAMSYHKPHATSSSECWRCLLTNFEQLFLFGKNMEQRVIWEREQNGSRFDR